MPDYRVVLVEPAFEESIGYVARAMKNFGLSRLHLANPIATLGQSGRMRGGHAQEILDAIVVHDSLQESVEGSDLVIGTTAQRVRSVSNLVRKPTTPKELSSILGGQDGEVALVFGREGTGLNNNELSQCDTIITIPSASDYLTLNLSHAAAIVFYELFEQSSATAGEQLATSDIRTTILHFLSLSMMWAGVEEYKVGLTTRAFRNVLGRSAIRSREGSLLAGALRRISETLAESNTDQEYLAGEGRSGFSKKRDRSGALARAHFRLI